MPVHFVFLNSVYMCFHGPHFIFDAEIYLLSRRTRCLKTVRKIWNGYIYMCVLLILKGTCLEVRTSSNR